MRAENPNSAWVLVKIARQEEVSVSISSLLHNVRMQKLSTRK